MKFILFVIRRQKLNLYGKCKNISFIVQELVKDKGNFLLTQYLNNRNYIVLGKVRYPTYCRDDDVYYL